MGLDIYAKGLVNQENPDLPFIMIGYIGYSLIMKDLARMAYGDEMGDLYADYHHIWTKEDCDFWDTRCNSDLDLLLFHPDNGGKFTPAECRRVYNAIKYFHLENERLNAYLEKFKKAFQHCAKRRVNLYYC